MLYKRQLCVSTAVIAGLALGSSAALGGVQFQTGNIQYTNVNFAADAHGYTIVGEVDHTGISVYFNGYGSPSVSSRSTPDQPIMLHGQHGVAFVEPYNPADQLYRITITAQTGYAFQNMDWKLDAVPPDDGWVTFTALDAIGNAIALTSGTDTFFFDHNGQNPFQGHAESDFGSYISTLVITSTVPIMDLKQVSVDIVQIPAPSAAAVLAVGMIATARRRR